MQGGTDIQHSWERRRSLNCKEMLRLVEMGNRIRDDAPPPPDDDSNYMFFNEVKGGEDELVDADGEK